MAKTQVKRDAVNLNDEEVKDDILSGIVDTEKRTYIFEKTYDMFGKTLHGTFEAKYMSITDRLRIGVIRAKLIDGVSALDKSLDPIASDISFMIAYLEVALTKKPRWWNYDLMSLEEDLIKVREVYNEVYEFNKSFRRIYAENQYAGSGSDTIGEETLED